MRACRIDLLFLLLVSIGVAVASPQGDVFRETFGVDRLVVVAALLGGFCAITFKGNLPLTVAGIAGSLAYMLSFAAVGMYLGPYATPLIDRLFGVTIAAAAPCSFLVSWGAPYLYERFAKKEKAQ